MKILCAYNRPQFIGVDDPERILDEHEIVKIHTYTEFKRVVQMNTVSPSPFAFVLADTVLPWDEQCGEMIPTILLMPEIRLGLIRGLGVFVPRFFESHFSFDQEEYHAFIASRVCWTTDGGRDWQKLLDELVERVERMT